MAELIDIFLTKKDDSENSSYSDEMIIKIKDNGEIKYFASTSCGFIKVEPCDMQSGYNERLFDVIKEVSLMNDIDKTLPVYLVNPLYNEGKIKAVIVYSQSGNHVVCLKTDNGKNLFGAYALKFHKESRNNFHKQGNKIRRSSLIKSIIQDLNSSAPELNIKLDSKNKNINE